MVMNTTLGGMWDGAGIGSNPASLDLTMGHDRRRIFGKLKALGCSRGWSR
jgi:hypothetical protein